MNSRLHLKQYISHKTTGITQFVHITNFKLGLQVLSCSNVDTYTSYKQMASKLYLSQPKTDLNPSNGASHLAFSDT